ncbi:hypothetical protein [Cellulomonas fimi]|uniref:Uncharacterized protein n=1 Tax=Cellulomonas fimi TaxID=1708 RepID=A0A7Y0LVZ7_CELFI|nr:hypothetical protein [Cellulomonas fimi]NMR19178.1 hypothetical protein [Cellulomonas fimi]
MSAPATYGDLMLRAAIGIQAGVAWMQGLPLEEPEFARNAMGDFRELLLALKEHTWVLLEPTRTQGITASATPDPRERAAVRLGEVLHEVVGPKPPWAWVGARVSQSPWGIAARCVHAAGELLATHFDASGDARTPDVDAVLRHPAARQAGLAEVGDMAATLLTGADHLALRALQAGVPWREIRDLVPDLAEAHAHARDVAGVGSLPTWAHLEQLAAAGAPIRTGDAAEEIYDRMLRLRRTAWEMARADHPSVDTLKTYATLGVAVHAHALAFFGGSPTAHATTVDPRHTALVRHGKAWQDLSRALFSWRAAEPADPRVTEDLHRLGHLLRPIAPLAAPAPDLPRGEARRLSQALVGAVRMTSEIATWNRTTVARMARAHQVYVPGRILAGEEVTDSQVLAEAKLTGRLAPVGEQQLGVVEDMYARVATVRIEALSGADGLTLRAEPLRVDVGHHAGQEPIGRSDP